MSLENVPGSEVEHRGSWICWHSYKDVQRCHNGKLNGNKGRTWNNVVHLS